MLRRTALALPATLLPGRARAQSWPSRPVRLVLPFAAGGPTDVIARLLAEALGQRLGQRFLVENRTGGGGNIGTSHVAKSPPDGSAFLFTNTSHALIRGLYAQLDFDPAGDFVPVSILAESPMVLLVPPNGPDRTLADFVARARAQPGRLTYASSGLGGALRLVSLLLMQAAGLDLQEVSYRGSAPAAQDLAARRLDMLYDAGVTAFPLAQGGQARALVTSGPQRSPVMPELPTVGEAGFPDATFSVWQTILAPAGTPPAILAALHAAIAEVLAEGALRRRLVELGAERILALPPGESQAYVARETSRWAALLRAANIEPQ